MQIVKVRFKSNGELIDYNANDLFIKKGQAVICESENGLVFGVAETDKVEIDTTGEFKKIVRLATDGDKKKLEDIEKKQKYAISFAKKMVRKHNLEMKVIDAEYTFDMSKLVFTFTADGRVDFRDLLKSLAGEFKTRIELKQVGVRDEAKILGGLGPCGRPLCCANHLKDFAKVGIKMAKDQGLSLNPSGINGVCGRLMCCLAYEEDDYVKALEKMPKLNSRVKTPDGEGVVTFNNVLKDEVSVKFINEDGSYNIKDYALGEISFEKRQVASNPKQEWKNWWFAIWRVENNSKQRLLLFF